MKHIVHIIPSLDRGGAEQTLVRLIQNSDPNFIRHSIICFKSKGSLYSEIANHLVNFKVIKWWNIFSFILTLKKWKPNVLQTWMYTANFIGFISGKLAGILKIYWNIRTSKLEWKYNSLSSILFCKVGGWLSKFSTKIICCSNNAIQNHLEKR